MLPRGTHIVRIIYLAVVSWPVDPASPLTTAGEELNNLGHDLIEVYNIKIDITPE